MAGFDYGYFAYMARRTKRRLAYRVCRRLYRDTVPSIDRALLLAGSARSGTTWLGDLIALQQPTRVMFEPFHPDQVPAYEDYNLFTYKRPGEEDEKLRRFCTQVFSGQIRNLWVDRTVAVLRPRARLIKDVRVNLLLKWIAGQFPELPLILLLRHPCAVVHSRLELGWATDGDIAPMLAQERLVEDFLGDKMEVIERASFDEEKHAIIWAIHNAVPLSQFAEGGINILRYEDLLMDATACLRGLFGSIGWDFDDALVSEYKVPSRTSSLATALDGAKVANQRWETQLSTAQIDRIFRVVEAFGLSHLYR